MSLDWDALLRQGVQGLRLTPEQFWVLTPYEFTLLRGDPRPGAGMGPQALVALMRRFPDQMETDND